MSTKVNGAGVSHAHSLIAAGKVNRGTWDFTGADGNKLLGPSGDNWGEYAKWFLATHPDATPQTKDYYGYPFGKDGEVYKNAVVSAKGRAAQQNATDVVDACSELLDKIDPAPAAHAKFKPTFFAKGKPNKGGEIYIYQDIGDGFFGGVSAQDVMAAINGLGAIDTLDIYVNSPGGSVFDGVAIYNQLKRIKAKKTVHIDGIAASIASIICMAGDRILCAPNAMMMIHDPWGMCMGTADEMRQQADTLDQIRDTLLDTYVARTKGDKATISKMMADETWMKADQAKALGFVDDIEQESMDPADMAFALLNKFKNTPAQLSAQSKATNVLIARMGMSKNLRRASPPQT